MRIIIITEMCRRPRKKKKGKGTFAKGNEIKKRGAKKTHEKQTTKKKRK